MADDRTVAQDSGGRRRSRRRATAQQGPPRAPAAAEPDTTEADTTEANSPEGVPAADIPERPAAGPVRAEPVRAAPVRAQSGDRPARKQPRNGDREGRGGRPAAKAARGDRDLAGSGSSQVGPTGAMRARDLNRPTAEDLAEAEAELTIVRRHWSPATGTPDQPQQAEQPRPAEKYRSPRSARRRRS